MTYNKIPKHGGYRDLMSFQMSEIIFDFTYEFVKQYVPQKSRTRDQMEQAARSGKQNIAEGSQTSGVNPKTELKLITVARASLEELKVDFEDFLRINNLKRWDKNDPRALAIRQLAYRPNKSYATYKSYMSDPESAANCALCIINQVNYLLDKQIQAIQKQYEDRGIQFESHSQKLRRIMAEDARREKEIDDMIKSMLPAPLEAYEKLLTGPADHPIHKQ